jgi:hypothetical protein
MKTSDRQRIAERLQEIEAWRSSGMSVKAYAQTLGQSLGVWRARLSWEKRWRCMLEANGSTTAPVAFVKATRAKRPTTQAAAITPPIAAPITVTLHTPHSAVCANVTWPAHSERACAAWLREVLA